MLDVTTRAVVGRLVPIVLIVAIVSACSSPAVRAPVGRDASRQKAPPAARSVPSARTSADPATYTVRKGDTLYSIAFRFGANFRSVARWNRIGPPYTIYPGQRLVLAEKRTAPARKVTKPRKRTASPKPTPKTKPRVATRERPRPVKKTPPPTAKPKTTKAPPKANRPSSSSSNARVARWAWPAKGKVIRRFKQQGNRGLDIAGAVGAPVYASAPGRVVYSGSGLIGYGKLIIIKHNERFLTAYAHNRKVLVSEGQRVSRGARIAEMGSTGTNRVKLHFEIRRDGRPVDPARYLPKR